MQFSSADVIPVDASVIYLNQVEIIVNLINEARCAALSFDQCPYPILPLTHVTHLYIRRRSIIISHHVTNNNCQ